MSQHMSQVLFIYYTAAQPEHTLLLSLVGCVAALSRAFCLFCVAPWLLSPCGQVSLEAMGEVASITAIWKSTSLLAQRKLHVRGCNIVEYLVGIIVHALAALVALGSHAGNATIASKEQTCMHPLLYSALHSWAFAIFEILDDLCAVSTLPSGLSVIQTDGVPVLPDRLQ